MWGVTTPMNIIIIIGVTKPVVSIAFFVLSLQWQIYRYSTMFSWTFQCYEGTVIDSAGEAVDFFFYQLIPRCSSWLFFPFFYQLIPRCSSRLFSFYQLTPRCSRGLFFFFHLAPRCASWLLSIFWFRGVIVGYTDRELTDGVMCRKGLILFLIMSVFFPNPSHTFLVIQIFQWSQTTNRGISKCCLFYKNDKL